ncbi:MAG: tRNA pseudouridine(55) synthase TruB [Neomegalonema sp.]|nr:tRNA pseudouridine(55) synthase TruB [Neomegalonema sp.]
MARRKRGNPVNGWLIIDKPLVVGSTDVVSKARWALQAQKAGHAGTLDPLATGLLAVAFGEATKVVPYAMDGVKTYEFSAAWGAATATDDLEGPVIARSDKRPTEAEIRAALPAFRGEVMQRPPAYSAIKVDGERAYDLARKGEEVAIAARPIRIERLELVDCADPDHASFILTCGKGGYVRSVARDLGEILGCRAHVTRLRRVAAGPFRIDDAISFETLENLRHKSGSESALLPVAAGLDDIPALPVDHIAATRLRQGQAVRFASAAEVTDLLNSDATLANRAEGETVWASLEGTPIAVGVVTRDELKPIRVFNLWAPEGDETRRP